MTPHAHDQDVDLVLVLGVRRLPQDVADLRESRRCSPRSSTGPFDDPDWLFEVKWDGFRVEAVVDRGAVRLWTRGEQDASRYFGAFLEPPTWIAAKRAIVDGEVIAFDEQR